MATRKELVYEYCIGIVGRSGADFGFVHGQDWEETRRQLEDFFPVTPIPDDDLVGMMQAVDPTYVVTEQDQAERQARRKALRKRMIQARNALTPEERAQRSARAVALLAESPLFRSARTVMIYDHVAGELSLDSLLEHPAAAGNSTIQRPEKGQSFGAMAVF